MKNEKRKNNKTLNNSPSLKNCELKKYNILTHRLAVIICMLLVFMLVIIGLPFLIKEIYIRIFSKIWSENELDLLPDFLGGIVGILTGFFLEMWFFERLTTLSKYKVLKNCLKDELIGIKKGLNNVWEGNLDKRNIYTLIFDDIIESAENSTIIFNLPRFNLFKKKGKLFNCLVDIYGNIKKYNRLIERNEDEKKLQVLKDYIIVKIEEFLNVQYNLSKE